MKGRKRVLEYRKPALSGIATGTGPAVLLTHPPLQVSNNLIAAWLGGLVWQRLEEAEAPQ